MVSIKFTHLRCDVVDWIHSTSSSSPRRIASHHVDPQRTCKLFWCSQRTIIINFSFLLLYFFNNYSNGLYVYHSVWLIICEILFSWIHLHSIHNNATTFISLVTIRIIIYSKNISLFLKTHQNEIENDFLDSNSH